MTSYYVCSVCFNSYPNRIELISLKCFAQLGEHLHVPKVKVIWTERMRLERVDVGSASTHQSSPTATIRPMPEVYTRGNFVLCDRQRCRGEKCTYAHSIEEREAWNRQKNRRSAPVISWGKKRSPHASKTKLQASESLHSAELPRSQQPQYFDFAETTRSDPDPGGLLPPIRSLSQPEGSTEYWFSNPTELQRAQSKKPYSSTIFTPPSGREERLPEHQLSNPAHSVTSAEWGPVLGLYDQFSDPVNLSPVATERDLAFGYHLSDPVPGHSSLVTTNQHPAHGYDPIYSFPPISGERKRKTVNPQANASHKSLIPAQPTSAMKTEGSQPQAHSQSDWPDLSSEPLQVLAQPPTSPWAMATPDSQYRATTTFQQQPKLAHDLTATKPARNSIYAAKRLTFEERRTEILQISSIRQELTKLNYQEKFHHLLCWEEMAHIHILDQRCNGHYTMVLHQASRRPSWLKFKPKSFHQRFGYLLGLDGDQIAYATQASEGAVIVHEGVEIKADILTENFQHTDEQLYLAFNQENLKKLEIHFSVPQVRYEREVNVEFELKHFYFNNLHRSLEELPPKIISRIIPESKDFKELDLSSVAIPDSYKSDLNLDSCSPDQLHALKTMISCPSDAPPILITGPFGTGKTQILATAAHYFILDSKRTRHPVQVLVCTQQQVSADTFLKCYFKVLAPRERAVQIIRLTTENSRRDPELSKLDVYKTVTDFNREFKGRSGKSLIVTTCQTSLHLAKTLRRGFFTHILLDEGAQMREPEGIAPLCMADEHTKIVIAGDQHQVGPAMLVLGNEAQENGLAVSLLERLQRQYSAMGAAASQYCASLITNYRCHKGILKLVERLFYESPFKCNVPRTSTHPHAHFPLCFVCSSIDDQVEFIKSATNEMEARIALKEVARFAKDWPEHGWGKQDLSQVCFMSSARSQVTVVGNLVKQMPDKLNELRRHPTYDIQGREFRALFLSTSEPTKENGETRNPTKSICDPHVFNTAITRTQSLVVSVGNPFMLLKTERHMIRKYGEKGKCWSQYLKTCLERGTLTIHSSLNVSQIEEKTCLEKLQSLVEEQLSRSPSATEMKSEDFASEDTQSTETLESSSSPHPKPTPQAKQQNSVEGLGQLPRDSRFERDYEVKTQLGKGGFGVVYHVKNRLDNAEYAVKLIKLPNSQSDQEKVLKEVRVLAKLSHERIVRYYSSWTEKAPPNWKETRLWSILASSTETCPWADHSSYAAIDDSSPPATPSSASSHSYSTDASVGAQKAEQESISSDFITFRETSNSDTPKEAAQEPPSSAAASVVPPVPTCLFIQTELCRKENLKKWLQSNINTRKRKTVMDLFNQILDGVCYIHENGLIHRDLKPSNIFFSEGGSIKVGDFGLVTGNIAGTMAKSLSQYAAALTPPMSSGQPYHSSFAGTFHYMSPEQLSGDRYNQKVDIYAMGVIYFELNCPFATQTERFKVLTDLRQAKLPPTFVTHLPYEASVVLELLADDPSERPAAKEIADSNLLKQLKSAIEHSELIHIPKIK